MRVIFLMALGISLSQSAGAQEQREATAHVHGAGTLDIAIEDSIVVLELSAPTHDLIGFEHEAITTEQIRAIERAQTIFDDPITLWGFPEAAECVVGKIFIDLSGIEHDEHDEHDESHTSATVKTELQCGAVDALTTLSPEYFNLFENSNLLTVRYIGGSSFYSGEISRTSPNLVLP